MPERKRRGRLEEQIDENLRRVYGRTVEEDVPDRFLRLLDQLRQGDMSETESENGEAHS